MTVLFKTIMFYIMFMHVAVAFDSVDEVSMNAAYQSANGTNLTINEIVASSSFIEVKNQFSLSTFSPDTWIRLKIKNHSAHPQKRILHNNFVYLNQKVEMYFYSGTEQVKRDIFDFSEESSTKRFTGSSLLHQIELKPNEELTIYVLSQSLYSQAYSFLLLEEQANKH